MYFIAGKYFRIFNNVPTVTRISHITWNFVTFYFYLHYSYMILLMFLIGLIGFKTTLLAVTSLTQFPFLTVSKKR